MFNTGCIDRDEMQIFFSMSHNIRDLKLIYQVQGIKGIYKERKASLIIYIIDNILYKREEGKKCLNPIKISKDIVNLDIDIIEDKEEAQSNNKLLRG